MTTSNSVLEELLFSGRITTYQVLVDTVFKLQTLTEREVANLQHSEFDRHRQLFFILSHSLTEVNYHKLSTTESFEFLLECDSMLLTSLQTSYLNLVSKQRLLLLDYEEYIESMSSLVTYTLHGDLLKSIPPHKLNSLQRSWLTYNYLLAERNSKREKQSYLINIASGLNGKLAEALSKDYEKADRKFMKGLTGKDPYQTDEVKNGVESNYRETSNWDETVREFEESLALQEQALSEVDSDFIGVDLPEGLNLDSFK